MKSTRRKLSIPGLDTLQQQLLGDISKMDLKIRTEFASFCTKLVALTSNPEAKIQDHIYAKYQNSRRRLPQERLDRVVPSVMLREVGFIAIVVNVTSEQPNVLFIKGKTERGVLGLEFPSQSRLTATWKSHHQVKRCHRNSDPRILA